MVLRSASTWRERIHTPSVRRRLRGAHLRPVTGVVAPGDQHPIAAAKGSDRRPIGAIEIGGVGTFGDGAGLTKETDRSGHSEQGAYEQADAGGSAKDSQDRAADCSTLAHFRVPPPGRSAREVPHPVTERGSIAAGLAIPPPSFTPTPCSVSPPEGGVPPRGEGQPLGQAARSVLSLAFVTPTTRNGWRSTLTF